MASSRARPYEQTVDVETPELVVLTYSIAGVGSRVLAALTDLLICAGMLLALLVGLIVLSRGRSSLASQGGASGSWALAVMILAQFVVLWGYYVLFEGLMDGQTPGKRIHRLRVVREGGYSVTFGVSAVRNLLRIVDMQPAFLYLVGLASLLFTRHSRRLGDLVAGTIVVREEARPPSEGPSGPVRERPGEAMLQTSLSEDEYLVLDRFVERWSSLEPLRRTALATQLAARFAGALPDDRRPPGPRLLELHAREQRARSRGVASRGETGAGRERQAIIAAGVPRWNRFAGQLATVQRKGLRSLGEEGVRDFVAEYRALAADLARLRTASGGRAMDELFQLGRLVAAAHNLLYRDRGMALRATVMFLFTDVPREIRRSAGPIALAAALLFIPAAVASVAVVRSPAIAVRLLPASMLKRAADGVRRAASGEGYIDDPQLFRPVMASSIVANNVQISFAAFAGGITAGLLPVVLLVANGISFGSVIGLYVSKGIGRLLLAFVAPHGVLELFAICVAGGGGFLLAAAILVPGARTRRRALVENSRRAMRLIAASTMLLLIAGTLEGFVSPIEWWPLEGKLAVSGVTLVLLVTFLRLGRTPTSPAASDDETGELALGAVTARRAP
ncbi:MAG: stage II sporulation protein M [Gemmatimonadota bacterium]|nr:stage II sporulation protein M [Gemmatimonadota bacterium]